ncbi:MAG: aminotransferase class IV [Nitrospinae bacterium]|nr:aminotransferase class IV [Nitrospinota bacterium]MBL7019014.1 aminotransferase class IV [Nitrospinaceae bacterium]
MQDSIVYINGLFTPLKNAKVSILDRGFCYGDGLFETMRAYKGNIFRPDQHLDRLLRSLPLIFIDLPMTRQEVKAVVQETLDRNKFNNAIIRLTVTRGINELSFQIDPEASPTLVIHARRHQPLPKAIYSKGVQITLLTLQAPNLPGVNRSLKSCNFLSNVMLREISQRKGSMEGIIVDPVLGVTEGATSNLFIVKQGVLKTPAVSNGVLEGITRRAVLEIAMNHKVPVEKGLLLAEDVLTADEVFITNSGIDIVPVVRVDDTSIGNKRPGILTRFLQDEFLKCVEEAC